MTPPLTGRFPNPLRAEVHDYNYRGMRVRIVDDFRYQPKGLPSVTVPCGFISDGASVPKIFHTFLNPYGSYFHAALIHDFLYSRQSTHFHHGIKRAMADRIFLQAMKDSHVGIITRSVIFLAVRTFGWIPYKKS